MILSKWNDITSDHSFIFKQSQLGSSDKLRVELVNSNNIGIANLHGATTTAVGQWTHVAVTYDTRTVTLFFNGSQDAMQDVGPSGLLRASAADLLIGATGSGVAENFSGLIDELSLYSRALTATDIQSIFQAGSDGKVNMPAMNVIANSPATGAIIDGASTDFAVDFSYAYDLSSVQPSDFTVNDRAADSFSATDPDTITFHFNSSPVTIGGPQTMAMGAGAVITSVVGVGRPSLAAWTTTFQARLSSTTFSAQLVDLLPGAGWPYPRSFPVLNNTAFFPVYDGTSYSLWKTDGTVAGTFKVISSQSVSQLADIVNVNGTLFFTAHPFSSPYQLWKSDGTASGTLLVDDSVNTGSRWPFLLGNIGNTLYFVARDNSLGDQLWRTDGTPAGTFMLSDVRPGGPVPGAEDEIGTTAVVLNNRLFFVAHDGSHGSELWVSDGTPQGTAMLLDLKPGSSFGAWADGMSVLNGYVYFRGKDEAADTIGLWRTDGTVTGTSLVKEKNGGPIASVMGRLFFGPFWVGSSGLWVTDGTTNGVTFLKDLRVTSSMVQMNSNVFFAANDGQHGNALSKTDGTAAGTVMVRAISGSSTAEISGLTNVNGKLFFAAYDALSGTELWESDGTETGTIMSRDINPGTSSSSPRNLASVNGHLVFTADDGVHGNELWVGGTITGNSYPWHNAEKPEDVTGDQAVVAGDALSVINYINAFGSGSVPSGALHQAPFYDVIADNNVSPNDALAVINFINAGGEGEETVEGEGEAVNNPPVADDVFLVGVSAHKPSVIRVSASDPDGDPLTYVIVKQPRSGTIVQEGGQLIYKPGPVPDVEASFDYQASDGQALSNVATAIVLLTQFRVTAVAEDGPQSIAGAAQQLFADVPPGGSPDLTFTTSNDKQSLFTEQPAIDSTGRLTFTPAPNSQGTATVTVVLDNNNPAAGGEAEGDGDGDADATATFTIDILQKAPWQNDSNPNDVDDDGHVSPGDGLLVIDYLNGIGSGSITNGFSEGPFFDTSGDGFVSPLDLLLVINVINITLYDPAPLVAEGEGSPATASSNKLGDLGCFVAVDNQAPSLGPPKFASATSDSDLLNLIALDCIEASLRRRRI